MKKAFLVKASVMTRIVMDVDDNFDVRDIDSTINGTVTDDEWYKAVEMAIPRLKDNICGDCIEEVVEDYEVPYDKEFDK